MLGLQVVIGLTTHIICSVESGLCTPSISLLSIKPGWIEYCVRPLLPKALHCYDESLTDAQHVLVCLCSDEVVLQAGVVPRLNNTPPVGNKVHAIRAVLDDSSWRPAPQQKDSHKSAKQKNCHIDCTKPNVCAISTAD